MCDFLPSYMSTLSSPMFGTIDANLIVIGIDDGKVYVVCQSKEDLFSKLALRKTRISMICYYRNMTFSQGELERAWHYGVSPISEKERLRIVARWTADLASVI